MRITEITLGVLRDDRPVVLRVEPRSSGASVIATPEGLPAERVAAAVRDTLARPSVRDPESAGSIPFVRVALAEGTHVLEVADDAGERIRMLTEASSPEAIPKILEARLGGTEEEDAAVEEILGRITLAAGVPGVSELAALLATAVQPVPEEASTEEVGYVDAERRASRLAAAVRAIDDRMTASVVPDWLWIATGFGGLGVLLTALVFLYPSTRIFLIPALILLSVIGFGLYGWRSFRELRLRGQLQIERAELRARRERARAEAQALRQALELAGVDPDQSLVRLANLVAPGSVPSVVAVPDPSCPTDPKRQTLLLVPSNLHHPNLLRFEEGESPHGVENRHG